MNDLDLDWQQRKCDGKIKYQDFPEARHAAKSLHKVIKARVDAYACPVCEFFHIGQRRSRLAAARRSARLEAKAV